MLNKQCMVCCEGECVLSDLLIADKISILGIIQDRFYTKPQWFDTALEKVLCGAVSCIRNLQGLLTTSVSVVQMEETRIILVKQTFCMSALYANIKAIKDS